MLNGAHFHLILNHIPVDGIPFGGILLLGGWVCRVPILIRTALIMIIVMGLFTVLAYFTGEPAERIALQYSDVSESLIHQHAMAANKAMYMTTAATLMAIVGLVFSFKHRAYPHWFLPTFLSLVVLTSLGLFWTAYLGGEIRHPEIRTSLNIFKSFEDYIHKNQPVYKEP